MTTVERIARVLHAEPVVLHANLAIRANCRVCGQPCCWVSTGWDALPPDGEPVRAGYWRHARALRRALT